jgi:hypothetical protein
MGGGTGKVKLSLLSEFGQSLYLMGLMAAMVGAYVGLGLLAIRVLG